MQNGPAVPIASADRQSPLIVHIVALHRRPLQVNIDAERRHMLPFSLCNFPSPPTFLSDACLHWRVFRIGVLSSVIVASLLAVNACGFLLKDEEVTSIPQTIETEQGPRSFAFDGEYVWVTLYGAQTIAKYSVDGQNVANYKAGAYPRALAFDGENMWVGNSSENTVTKLSLDGEILDTVSIGTHDTSPAALVFDGESVWVAASWGNSVTKVNLDGSVVKTVRIPGYHPSPWAITHDGTSVWVASMGSVAVDRLDRAGELTGSFEIAKWPKGRTEAWGGGGTAVAFDGESIWVANFGQVP